MTSRPGPCERLEEYLDGELSDRDASDFKAHLGACPACAKELAGLEQLNGLLKRAPAASPSADYVERVVARARRRPALKIYTALFAAAAALMIAFIVYTKPGPVGVEKPYGAEEAFRDFGGDAVARAKAVAWLRSQGEAVEKVLLEALTDTSIPKQKTAGLMIASLDDQRRERILAAHAAAPLEREWELQPIGSDLTDVELVGYAMQLAKSERTFEEAAQILRKLDKDAYNRSAHHEIVRSLKEMFASGQDASIRAGFRVAERLDLLVEDVVEFLDVPELGDRALEFLKRGTGKDYGRDKDAWRAYFGGM